VRDQQAQLVSRVRLALQDQRAQDRQGQLELLEQPEELDQRVRQGRRVKLALPEFKAQLVPLARRVQQARLAPLEILVQQASVQLGQLAPQDRQDQREQLEAQDLRARASLGRPDLLALREVREQLARLDKQDQRGRLAQQE